MALDLSTLEESGVNYGIESLKILIYGGNTLGKTPQAMNFPKPLLFMGEAGGGAVKGRKVSIKSKKEFVDYVLQLTNDKNLDKMKEIYQTIILDTASDIIDLYKDAVAADYGKTDISQVKPTKEEPNLPNGYSLFRNDFKKDINLLCSKGYTVIFIMHEELAEVKETTVTFNDKKGVNVVTPIGTGTFKYMPKGSSNEKDSARFLRNLCDFRFYIKGNGIDEEGHVIPSTAFCHETVDFYAGSRFDIQNVVNPFTADNLIKAMTEAQKRSAENYGANFVTFELKDDNYTKADYIRDITPIAKAVYPLYPDEYNEIVVRQLKTTNRISDAKESQLRELNSIYTQLEAFAREHNLEY